MKILIFLKSVDGGTGTFVQNLLKTQPFLKTADSIIKVLVLEEPTYRKIEYKTSYIYGKQHYPQRYGLDLNLPLSFYEEYRKVSHFLSEFGPDLVLSIDVHCNLIALIYKLFSRHDVKVIASTHITLSEVLREKAALPIRWLLKALVKALYSYADILVAVSNGIRRDLISHFQISKNIQVFYNGIESKRFIKRGDKHRKRLRVLSVARLVPQKDFVTLIHAFSQLTREIPDATLTIIGDGTQRTELENLADKLLVHKNIVFVGWKNDITPYMKDADIFVLSSLREGFPYVLLEAMSYGLPIISTDAPSGPRELLLENQYGMLVPIGNVEAMKYAMETMLKSGRVYSHYATQARKRAGEFTVEKMADGYRRLIAEITKEKRAN